jgi:hypothetical protein
MGTKIKHMRGAASTGLGTTIKYLRRITNQRPGRHDQVPATLNELRRTQQPGCNYQVPATHNERCRGQHPEPIPGITYVPLHHKRPALALFGAHACAFFAYKQNSTSEVWGLGAVFVEPG